MKEAIAKLEKINAISEIDFEEYVSQKKKEIVTYHLKNTVSYREFVGESSFKNWDELPTMTKKAFQKPLKEGIELLNTIQEVY